MKVALLLLLPAVVSANILGRPIERKQEIQKREQLRRLRRNAPASLETPAVRGGPRKLKGKMEQKRRVLPRGAGNNKRHTNYHDDYSGQDDGYYGDDDRYYDDDGYKRKPRYDDDYHYGYGGKSGMGMSGMGKSGMGMSGMGKSGMGGSMGRGGGYYYSGKGKGKSGMGMGGGYGGYDDHYDDDFYPTVDDIAFLDDAFFDDHFFEDDDCELVTFNETFAIPGPTLFLAPDTSITDPGTPELPGTVFIFELIDVLEIDGATALNGTTLSGTCTRTTVGVDGGGICSLVFIDSDGFTINVDGFLPGPFGGPMAISGGTGGMVGVIGEMDFFPIFENTTSPGDIFLDAVRYEVIADLGLIVCP